VVIVEPPSLGGAVNATESCALPAVIPVIVGAGATTAEMTKELDVTGRRPVDVAVSV
jgi:hypothetical protein